MEWNGLRIKGLNSRIRSECEQLLNGYRSGRQLRRLDSRTQLLPLLGAETISGLNSCDFAFTIHNLGALLLELSEIDVHSSGQWMIRIAVTDSISQRVGWAQSIRSVPFVEVEQEGLDSPLLGLQRDAKLRSKRARMPEWIEVENCLKNLGSYGSPCPDQDAQTIKGCGHV